MSELTGSWLTRSWTTALLCRSRARFTVFLLTSYVDIPSPFLSWLLSSDWLTGKNNCHQPTPDLLYLICCTNLSCGGNSEFLNQASTVKHISPNSHTGVHLGQVGSKQMRHKMFIITEPFRDISHLVSVDIVIHSHEDRNISPQDKITYCRSLPLAILVQNWGKLGMLSNFTRVTYHDNMLTVSNNPSVWNHLQYVSSFNCSGFSFSLSPISTATDCLVHGIIVNSTNVGLFVCFPPSIRPPQTHEVLVILAMQSIWVRPELPTTCVL